MINEPRSEMEKPGNTFTQGSSGNQNTVTVNDTPGLILMFVVALFLLRLLLFERRRMDRLLEQWTAFLNERRRL